MGNHLLNYDFQIQYLSTNKIGHADGLSRLIPRTSETFEDTIIAALRSENEVENTLNNTIKELLVSLKEKKRIDFIRLIRYLLRGMLLWVKEGYIYIYIYIYIYTVSQKWVHPSHFCRYLSISLHGTTLTKWHIGTMKSSLWAAYITELIYFPLKITQNIAIKT